LKIKIITVGKIKEKLYQKRIEEYIKWISKHSQIQIITLKSKHEEKLNKHLLKYLKSNSFTICLSEEGKSETSKQFSNFLYKQNKEIIFFIGDSNGHPEFVRNLSNKVLSLSKMTFLHEMSLLILCEQIFRGISIKQGSKYHK
tara:strand:- start:169 stop:597 length:429 start_codon:yes stop_codon:yes gene_type:complete